MTGQVCEKKKDIEELIEKIETAASFIDTVNPDNIFILHPEDFDYVSEFAEKIIRQHNIPLYDSPYADYVYDELEKLISAKNQKEFIDALEQYARALQEWAKLEEEGYLNVSDEISIDVRDVSELALKEEIYSNYWDVWDYGIYRGRARITIYKERRKLFTKELELYTAELYHPTYGFCTLKIDTDDEIDDIIEDLNELFEEYENSQLTSYELYEKITEVL